MIVGPGGAAVPFFTSPDSETPGGTVEPGSRALVERTTDERLLVALEESVAEKRWVKKESAVEVVTVPDGLRTVLELLGLAAISALIAIGLNVLPSSVRHLLRTGGVGAFLEPVSPTEPRPSSTIATAIGSGGVALFTADASEKAADRIHTT